MHVRQLFVGAHDLVDDAADAGDGRDHAAANAGDREQRSGDRARHALRRVRGLVHRRGKAIGAGSIRIDHKLGHNLRHGLGFPAKEIVQHLDQLDLERRQADAGQPDERVEIGPGDRLGREAGPPARVEPAEGRPDVLELERERRRLELGLDLGAPLRLVRPIEQTLEDLPIRNAVLERRELEIFLGKSPQLVAEG